MFIGNPKVNCSINLRLQIAILAVFACGVVPALARTKSGDKLLKEGEKAEAHKDYETALNDYSRALDTDPSEPAYLIAVNRVRSTASQSYVAKGRELQKNQQLNEALVEFQRAILADPSSQIALQEIRQTTAMIKEKAKAPPGTVILTPAEKARKEVEARINSLEGPPQLRPINNEITSLKMNNQPPRVLYESVCKLAGINVLFDPAGLESSFGAGTKNVNLDLNNVTVEEALDYVALVTHTFWKPISRNAIFVTQESEPKRQEYQDEVVKVFYIQNASTPNEFTEIFNGVRTGAKLTTGIFQVASQNAIIARGTPDTIALVEKLVHDLDRPKPEVVVDVMVMEVSKSKISTLGAALAGQTGGLNVPIQFTPRNPVLFGGNTGSNSGSSGSTTGGTTTGGTTNNGTSNGTNTNDGSIPLTPLTPSNNTPTNQYIALSKVGKISTNDFSISLPGALLQALMTDASTHLLQRPEVRVTDGGKAVLKVGSKIPYVSGSLNSAIATPGTIPYATTQFQQVDVGVQIELAPHVNAPNDVSMHIKVEISNVVQTETIAGIAQPIIGQKVDEADIRMKDGEVSLLGGLTSDSNSRTLSGIPGVANIPLLGYLFGTRNRDREKDDIIVALIPHIVRAPDLTDVASEGVYAGTERVVKVERKPDGNAPPPTPLPIPSNERTPAPPASAPPAPAPQNPNAPRGYPPVQPLPNQAPQSQPPQNQAPAPQGQAPQSPVQPPVLAPQSAPNRPPLLAPQSSPNRPPLLAPQSSPQSGAPAPQSNGNPPASPRNP